MRLSAFNTSKLLHCPVLTVAMLKVTIPRFIISGEDASRKRTRRRLLPMP